MRILITGADGQLGRALRSALASHDVIACSHRDVDVRDRERVRTVIARAVPDAVIHTAALTDTARCEREPELAMAVNAAGTAAVAEAAVQVGARLIAISTNEVFDGDKGAPYAESDEPRPINMYGASKREGERAALAAARGAVVRTSWLYGNGGTSFVTKLMAVARSGRPLMYVTDEVAAPTSAADLADAIGQLLEHPDAAGVFHLAGEGEASRYDWAVEILRLAGVDGRVDPTTSAELRAAGYEGPRKPAYSVLANERGRGLGITLRPWREALAAHMQHVEVRADG